MNFKKLLIILVIFTGYLFAGISVSPISGDSEDVFTIEYKSSTSLESYDPKVYLYRDNTLISTDSLIKQTSIHYAKAYKPSLSANYKARVGLLSEGKRIYSNYIFFIINESLSSPSLSTISPTSLIPSSSGQTVNLSGSNFNSDSKIYVNATDGNGYRYVGSTYQTYNNSASMSTELKTTLQASGSWYIKVCNGLNETKCSSSKTITIKSIINGQCGTANGKNYYSSIISYPSNDTACTKGTESGFNFPSVGSTDNWTCNGLNGGSNVSCSASRDNITVPSPSLSTISPTSLIPSSSGQTVNLSGSNFNSDSKIYVNATDGNGYRYVGSTYQTYNNSASMSTELKTTLQASGSWYIKVCNGLNETKCSSSKTITISASINRVPAKPIIDSQEFKVNLSEGIKISRGLDPDGDEVELVCWATNSNRTTSNPYISSPATHSNDLTVSFLFSKSGSQTISCKSVDSKNAESDITTKNIVVDSDNNLSITSISPNEIDATKSGLKLVTITGKGFSSDSELFFRIGEDGNFTKHNTESISESTIESLLIYSSGIGKWYFKVKNNSVESNVVSISFSQGVSLPKVISVTPKIANKNELTTFTVKGIFPSTLAMSLEGSESCGNVSLNNDKTEATISCTPFTTGDMRFYIKDKTGGSIIEGSSDIRITITDSTTVLPSSVDSPVNGTGWNYRQHTQDNATYYDGIGTSNDNNTWDLNYGSGYDDDGLPVYAVEDGIRQTFDGWGGSSYGQFLVKHTNSNGSWYSGYLHMKNITTATTIKKGDKIGEISRTGYLVNPAITSPHLHFGVYELVNNQLLSRNITINKNIIWEIEKENTAPKHISTETDLININNAQSFTVVSKWKDSDGDYIVDIKARYRDKNNGSYTNIVLSHISSDRDGEKFIYTFENGLVAGEYEIEVQSSDKRLLQDLDVLHTTEWIKVSNIKVYDVGSDPTLTMLDNLPECKSSEHKDKGYACIKTGTKIDLTFTANDIDGDLKRLDVNVDGLTTREFKKDLSGSSATVNEEYTFSKDMFSSNCDKCTECEGKYKNQCFREFFKLTASVYDKRNKSYDGANVESEFLLYDLDVHKNQGIIKENKKKKEAEEEKLILKLEINQKNNEKLNIETKINEKKNEYLTKLDEYLNSYGEVPSGLVNNDCAWREKGTCVDLKIIKNKPYQYKKKNEDYQRYPFTIYVNYSYGKDDQLYKDYNDYFPAELIVEYHLPENLVKLFFHDKKNPSQLDKAIVYNSKELELQMDYFIDIVKNRLDASKDKYVDLYFEHDVDKLYKPIYDTYKKTGRILFLTLDETNRYFNNMIDVIKNSDLTDIEKEEVISFIFDFVPIVQSAKALSQSYLGQEWFTLDEVSSTGELIGIIPYSKVYKKGNKFFKNFKQIIKNYKIGKRAEKLLKGNIKLTDEFGSLISKVSEGKQLSYKATNGERRYFDLFSKSTKTAIESKVGNPKLTTFAKKQIIKDIDALKTKHAKKIVWISHANDKGEVGFDENFIKYAKDLLKSKGMDTNLFEFRGKNIVPPYLNTGLIYNGIN